MFPWKKLMASILIFLTALLLLPMLIVRAPRGTIVTVADAAPAKVAIVFGAGLKRDSTPSDALMDRLRVAAELYQQKKVQTILVSGDNRFAEYSEPDAMKMTLINTLKVPADVVRTDYAGRRTYDTCIRAHDLWGVDRAILVSQDFHLPRAIWTCRRLGIDAQGVSASLQPYIMGQWYRQRETAARYKAFTDIYLWRPHYVSGATMEDVDS